MEMVNLEMRSLGLPPGLHLSVQVGIDSGFAIAGVIGHKTFQYDLCGDAVNTAARMCSYSEPGRVNVSQRTHALLRHRFSSEEQAEREIKGKGKMKTYFLNNTPPPAMPDRDAPSRPATCPALQLSAGEAGTMIEAGAVRRAPTLEGGSSSPRHSGVSFEGDSCPEERASRDSWGDQGDQGDQRSGSCPADIRPDAIESSGSVGPTPPLSCCEC
jgi:hypothetical protein